MFRIEYWNPQHAEWRGCGEPPCPTRDQARERIAALREQCDYCVRFRTFPAPVFA